MPPARLLVFITLLVFLFVSTLYFINTLYFTAILIFSVLFVSVYSVYLGLISSLFSIMLIIVYVGAIMIFIGYICAISPNILIRSSMSYYTLVISLLFSGLSVYLVPSFGLNFHPVTDFLYSSVGFYLFVLVALVLFIVLLIVSSQFFSPQGPFRSVT